MGKQSLKHADKKKFKHNIICIASEIFCLSETEKESLANKAGLSFCSDGDFVQHFQNLIEVLDKFYREIYEEAQVSERMFYHIKSGCIPTKAVLMALAVALKLNIYEIENLLQKAGYVLSKSIAFDMVVKWLIENDEHKAKGLSRICYINYILYDLRLPLLMTRERVE